MVKRAQAPLCGAMPANNHLKPLRPWGSAPTPCKPFEKGLTENFKRKAALCLKPQNHYFQTKRGVITMIKNSDSEEEELKKSEEWLEKDEKELPF